MDPDEYKFEGLFSSSIIEKDSALNKNIKKRKTKIYQKKNWKIHTINFNLLLKINYL